MASRADCIGMLRKGGLSEQEAAEIVDMSLAEKKRIQAEGRVATPADMAAFANAKGEQMKQAAAMQRKQAAINVLVRKEIADHLETWVAAGGDRVEGLMAYLVGSPKALEGARDSIGARIAAMRGDWVGGLMGKLDAMPGVVKLIERDKDFGADVVREMHQIKPDGKPGITGNEVARQVADVLADYSELARVRQNEAGAAIGKLAGWVPQSHDESKIVAAGFNKWRDFIMPLLDHDRTFGQEGRVIEDPAAWLSEAYQNIITGRDGVMTAREKGEFVSPRNLASSLGKHRELHFKDADAQIIYQDRFGRGSALENILHHLDGAARRVAVMERLGPNPDVMMGSVAEELMRRLHTDATMDDAATAQAIRGLSRAWNGGKLQQSMDVLTGIANHPVNRQAAAIMSGARAVQSMAKLGGAVLSSIADVVTYATNFRYMGRNLFEGYLDAFRNILHGRGDAEQRQLAMHLGTIYDGILGDVMARLSVEDNPVRGRLASMMNTFFKVSGMNLWTDSLKGGYVRGLSSWIGDQAGKEFRELDGPLRAVFGYHGIDESKWNAMRHMVEEVDGKTYLLPQLVDKIPDEAIRPLVADRLESAAKSITDPERLSAHEAFVLRKERERLRVDAMSFFIDETAHAVIEPDFRTRRNMTLGNRPGTLAGEAIRFIMQFKSFPMAFIQKTLREQRFGVAGEKGFDVPGFVQFAAASMLFGYAAMTAKDFVKGKQPRDPANTETWLAAALQSGGLGIYGDFLFGQVNRFGNDLLSSAAGPGIGTAAQVLSLPSKTIHGDVEASDVLRIAMENTPFVNLWYTKAATDYLLLYHLKEMMSPGTLRRMERKARQDYNQQFIVPPSTVIQRGGGFR